VLAVERRGIHDSTIGPQPLGPHACVLGPEFVGCGERVDHLGSLTLPLRVLVAVEDAIGQVVGPHHRQRHQPGDLPPGSRHAEDRARKDALARGAL